LRPPAERRSARNKNSLSLPQTALGELNKMPRDSLCGVWILYVCHYCSQLHTRLTIIQGGNHYTFEDPKGSTSSDSSRPSAPEWVECLERAKELAVSQSSSEGSFNDMPSTMPSPASTMGGRAVYAEGFGVSDRAGRNHLSKSQASLEDPAPKRNRFSKRQSRSGLGSAF
jgi:hypothetical protein